MSCIYRILGAGEWGIAVGYHLAMNGHNVELYGRNSNKFCQLIESKKNPKLGINLDCISKISTLDQLPSEGNNHINIISSSSEGFCDLVFNLKTYLTKSSSLIWLTKGLDNNSGKLFDQVIREEINSDQILCLMSGPSFALDLVNKQIQSISIACNNNEFMDNIVEDMKTDHFNLIKSKDLVGVQISGIIKNISAILSGSMVTLGYSLDDIYRLIQQSQNEVKYLTSSIYKQRGLNISENEVDETLNSPCCIGDLELTCLNDKSRNRAFGIQLPQNKDIKTILDEVGTVEGYISAHTLVKKTDLRVGKIVKTAYEILYENGDIQKNLENLFN